jgi:uncharacterized protein (UPF0261 family)
MEELVRQRQFGCVLDITTTELADEVVGGTLSAGPRRLEAAGEMGIPQVVVPGALDMVNFGVPETVPTKFAGRVFYRHGPATTLMRTSTEEMAILGKLVAQKLNRSGGPTTVIIPQGGFSAYDRPGGPFYDPGADRTFVEELLAHISNAIPVVLRDEHINDPAFAQALTDDVMAMLLC